MKTLGASLLILAGTCLWAFADAPLTLSQAEAFRRLGQADEARKILSSEGFSDTDGGATLIEIAELFRESGSYGDAVNLARYAIDVYGSDDIAILGIGRNILKQTGFPEETEALLDKINQLALERKKARDPFAPAELVELGKIAVESRVDPVKVFDQFYKPALKKSPRLLRGYLAAADLAMKNKDFKYAQEWLNNGIKKYGQHSELHVRLSEVYYYSGALPKAVQEAQKSISINPNHISTLLLEAARSTYTENFTESDTTFAQIFSIDPYHPKARALQAVRYHHRRKDDLAAESRKKALQVWPESPYVDYWIGSMMGRMLLLEEAIPFLQNAYEIDSNLIEAKAELALVNLRSGNEEKGWRLMEEVRLQDPYNILAFNYADLRDFMAEMEVIETPHFLIRLPAKDRKLYGDRSLEILERARTEMVERYGFTPTKRTIIDFFPQTQDFNVRLAGIPGGLGILGACFGDVIAMQSAGGVGMLGNNWEETLWHEYAHTITVGATSSRIPRWLTEGCSVHEEGLLGEAHRRRLDSSFQPLFAEKKLISFSDLNERFSGQNVMFAYFQSGRMVDYLVETHGYEKLRLVLKDLGNGRPIREAFEEHLEPIDELEANFASVAQEEAISLAPDLDWSLPDNPALLKRDTKALENLISEKPNNLFAIKTQCSVLARQKRWEELEKLANHLLKLHPTDGSPDCARYFLSIVARFKNDIATEKKWLQGWLPYSSNATYAYERLIAIETREKQWPAVLQHSKHLFGVNPMTHLPHRGMGLAYENLNQPELAINSYEKLLLTDQINPARTHYRLGSLREKKEPTKAKRHALDAISESPRFRDAHLLLRRLNGKCSCGKH